jgi:hypothetical protein
VPGATGHVAMPELSDTRRHRSPPLPGAESGIVGLDLGLVHRGTRSAGYRQCLLPRTTFVDIAKEVYEIVTYA